MPKIGELLKDIQPLGSVADCGLVSVIFDRVKNALTLHIDTSETAEKSVSFEDLSKAEDVVKLSLDLDKVRIIPREVPKPVQNEDFPPLPPLPPEPPLREEPPVQNILTPPMQMTPPIQSAPVNPVKSDKPVKAEKSEKSDKNAKSADGEVVLGKKITAPVIPMESLSRGTEVAVCGEVFSKDTRTLKNDKSVTVINFTDKTSSVTMKFFLSSKQKVEAEKRIQKGTSVLVQGKYDYDDFEKSCVLEPIAITLIQPVEKTDDYDGLKRAELHIHTKMSDMDATNTAAEYVERAYKWGHRAVAVTDHGNVQAFPEVMNTYEKIMKSDPDADFRVVYGVEAYFVNDGNPLITEAGNFLFSGEFIVFDLETTGLSPADCRITEIGAAKLRNMEVVEEFSTFVNPGIPIPDEVTKLTGITDDMVRDAPYEREALEAFLKFCGSDKSALVAHNAPFDMGFLRSGLNRCGIKHDFSVIDTLTLSRAAVPEKKSHKLNLMVEHYKLGEFHHHRALDDAKITALLFKRIISDASKGRGLERMSDLNSVFGGIDVKKIKPFHMIILVQNKVGLKNLYKLVSYSNLYYFHGKPRIPLSELKKFREGLLIGSACEQGELFQAVLKGKSQQDLLGIAEFYDFLEIQPVGNNAFLVRNGDAASEV
ncbi:MAG: PHP domain-containing protein, partial [Oscillospiraceae bacterium]|nr:PHP domain-containing protein [Oscillospiraceae bacterium]